MPVYVCHNGLAGAQQAIAAAYKTLVAVTAATTGLRRFKVTDLLMGTAGTPADNFMEWDLSAQTAAGTSTAATPNKTDQADGVSSAVGSVNFTAEGTITAASSLFYLGVNQRASYRWVPTPGQEIVAPAINLNGFAFRTRSAAYTGLATGQMNILE